MPIYAYKCESCGHAKDVMQKMADAPLSDCPACGEASFKKQLTAPGFQLKGSGWYVTDFKNGGGSSASGAAATSTATAAASDVAKAASSTEASAPAAATPCGGPCACH